jgi:hypothetical protein
MLWIVSPTPKKGYKHSELYGQTIEVKYCDGLVQDNDNVGEARYRKNQIMIQRSCDRVRIKKEQMEHTFLHELVHWYFYSLGEEELRKNEKLMDTLAGLIHQFYQTAEC